MGTINCHICGAKTRSIIDEQLHITYDVCDSCDFISKSKGYQLDSISEEKIYDLHDNSFESKGYVAIFENLIANYIRPLNIKGNVLEFGSGPGPVLKELLSREPGLEVYDFDPFYNNNEAYKSRKYNLITTTEVVEHFYEPMKEFKHLYDLLAQDGYLVVMTKFRTMDDASFLQWWYRRDGTHVSFYNMNTFNEISNRVGLTIASTNNENIVIFIKK